MTSRLLGVLLLGLAALTGCADDQDTAAEEQAAHWSHDDPDAWGGTCSSGTEQSPVDLTGASEEDLPEIVFDYQPADVTVTNTGHTIEATYGTGSAIGIDGTWFDLVQFHVHAPSEHTIDGEPAAAELHLVHQDDDNNLAVIGVLVEQGDPSATIAPVLDSAPRTEGEESEPTTEIDADGLLPESRLTYRYDGSLTTPPCTEGVRWMVMTDPVTWSAEQLAAFTELYDGTNRPVQPLGDRVELVDTAQ